MNALSSRTVSSTLRATTAKRLRVAAKSSSTRAVATRVRASSSESDASANDDDTLVATRRAVALSSPVALAALLAIATPPAVLAGADDCENCSNSNSSLGPGDKAFVQSPSGVRYAELREGTGASPADGDVVVVEWVGYTEGYQAKKIESTRETDAPFIFKLGAGEAIPAFEEAVREMRVGGIRRIEIPGELEEKLAYSRNAAGASSSRTGPHTTPFAW
jgi:hypothetical protein